MSEAMMSWTKKAVMDTGPFKRLMMSMVRSRQALGYGKDYAMEDTALALGTTPRRVRSFIRNEVFAAPVDEYELYVRQRWATIDKQTAEIQALAITLQKEAEAEWLVLNQPSLPLFEATSLPSARGGRRVAGG
jgi:hypothetical protein